MCRYLLLDLMVVDVDYVNKKNCFTESVVNFSFTLGLHGEAITRHRLLQAHITVASELYILLAFNNARHHLSFLDNI